MSEPFIAEIKMFGGNFAPRGWAFCDGQLLSIPQNNALFSILGTTYGGDGRTTFGLPDLRGRVAMHPGRGPGLTTRQLGQKSGSETNTLIVQNLPSHNHGVTIKASTGAITHDMPASGLSLGAAEIYTSSASDVDLAVSTSQNTGGGQSVNNMQPYSCVNYIIALQGVYPSRS